MPTIITMITTTMMINTRNPTTAGTRMAVPPTITIASNFLSLTAPPSISTFSQISKATC